MRVHRFAILTASLTLLLLLFGGLVAGSHSGLACPDWPTCFGSYFPAYQGGVEFEHTHRVVALLVGLCTVVLAAMLVRRGRWLWVALFVLPLGLRGSLTRISADAGKVYVLASIAAFTALAAVLLVQALRGRSVQRAALAAGALVNVQGMLGGLTVLFELPPIVSIIHLGTAMLFFTLLVTIAMATRPSHEGGEGISRWVALAPVLVFVQILLGAITRHLDAGLACGPEVPLCRGAFIPWSAHPAVIVHAVHRWHALVAAAVVLAASLHVHRRAAGRHLRALALALPILVAVQIILGVLSVLTWLDLWIVTAHLGVGAALLAGSLLLWLLARPAQDPALVLAT